MSLISQTGSLNRADGSATVVSGETKVIVSVTGPIEPKARQELPTSAALEVIVRADVGISNTREKLLEDKLRSVLAQAIITTIYPRQLIQITAQVLESGEDSDYTSKELSVIINASYLALIDAGIALNYSFASSSFAIDFNGETSVNPSREELRNSKSSHVVVYDIKDAASQNILFSDSIGTFTESQVYSVLDKGASETEKIHKLLRKTIEAKVEKDFIWKI